jgi:hypothetical protein
VANLGPLYAATRGRIWRGRADDGDVLILWPHLPRYGAGAGGGGYAPESAAAGLDTLAAPTFGAGGFCQPKLGGVDRGGEWPGTGCNKGYMVCYSTIAARSGESSPGAGARRCVVVWGVAWRRRDKG